MLAVATVLTMDEAIQFSNEVIDPESVLTFIKNELGSISVVFRTTPDAIRAIVRFHNIDVKPRLEEKIQ